MKKVANYVFVRHRHNWIQLFRFGLVGGSGVLVNMLVMIALNKIFPGVWEQVATPLPITDFNIRWYHVFNAVAFLVANTWNYQLNRMWTFKSQHHAGWFREFFPFLATGLVAFGVGLVIQTLLLKEGSPIALPRDVFDGSTGLRTPLYWAQLIQIIITMPINFVVNKLWTFRAVRHKRTHPTDELPMVAPVVAPEAVDEDGEPLPAER